MSNSNGGYSSSMFFKWKLSTVELPLDLMGYKLLSTFRLKEVEHDHAVGIYACGLSQIIIKLCRRSVLSESYWRLRTEAAFSIALSKHSKLFTDQFIYHFAVPKTELVTHIPQLFGFFQPYVQVSVDSESVSDEQLASLIVGAHDYLQLATTRLSKSEIGQLTKLSGVQLLLRLPIVLIKACCAFPYMSLTFLQAAILLISSVPTLRTAAATTITHRDLSADNFLICNQTIFIIDFGYAVVTFPEYELICAAILHWDNPVVRDHCLTRVYEESANSKRSRMLARAAASYCCLAFLGSPNIPSTARRRYMSALEYWLKDTAHTKGLPLFR